MQAYVLYVETKFQPNNEEEGCFGSGDKSHLQNSHVQGVKVEIECRRMSYTLKRNFNPTTKKRAVLEVATSEVELCL